MKVTLRKRGEIYYASKQKNGTRHEVSTGSRDPQEAQRIGAKKLRDIIDGNTPAGKQSIAKVWNLYERNATHLKPSSLKASKIALSSYLGTLRISWESDWTVAFNPNAARHFYQTRLRGLQGLEKQRRTRTANSVIRQLKALFSKRLQPDSIYGRLPDKVKDFRDCRLMPEVNKTYEATSKRDAMREVIEKSEQLKAVDRDAYLMLYLALYGGLRKGEIAAAQWDWIEEGKGIRVQATEDWEPKNGKSRLIPLSEAQIEHLRGFQGDSENILCGTQEERYRNTGDRLGRFLRSCGIIDQKPIHELRKYFGANVATQQGIFAAQKILGHHSPELTSKYYADLLDPEPIEVRII